MYAWYAVSCGRAIYGSVMVLEYPGHDCVSGCSGTSLDGVTSLCCKVVAHGFLYPPCEELESLFEVIPLEVLGGSSFGAEDFLVPDGEVGPVVVEASGIEGVAVGSGSTMMVNLKRVGVLPLEDLLSVGEEIQGTGVTVLGVRVIGEPSWWGMEGPTPNALGLLQNILLYLRTESQKSPIE